MALESMQTYSEMRERINRAGRSLDAIAALMEHETNIDDLHEYTTAAQRIALLLHGYLDGLGAAKRRSYSRWLDDACAITEKEE